MNAINMSGTKATVEHSLRSAWTEESFISAAQMLKDGLYAEV